MNRRLYRDPAHGSLGGVCAGLADYLGIEIWVVRLGAVTGLLFASFLTILLYLVAWGLLDKKPQDPSRYESQGAQVKQHGWQQGLNPQQALERVDMQLADLEKRLQAMEQCVTSREFQLRRDFQRL